MYWSFPVDDQSVQACFVPWLKDSKVKQLGEYITKEGILNTWSGGFLIKISCARSWWSLTHRIEKDNSNTCVRCKRSLFHVRLICHSGADGQLPRAYLVWEVLELILGNGCHWVPVMWHVGLGPWAVRKFCDSGKPGECYIQSMFLGAGRACAVFPWYNIQDLVFLDLCHGE